MCNYLLQCKLKSLEKRGIEPTAKILKENLTEVEAYNEERYYISLFKKKVDGGTLCNVLDGGNHPPSPIVIKESYSTEKYKKIIRKQRNTFKQTIKQRNNLKVKRASQLMKAGKMIKDIALELKVTPPTIRTWLKQSNTPVNYEGKKKAIKLHLKKLSKNRKNNKIPTTAKTYTILTPDKTVVVTQRLVVFCQEHRIDYSGLRQTYNGKLKHFKGYVIIDVVEPVR